MKLSQRITKAIDLLYIKPIAKVIPRQTFRYLACGGANMLLGVIIYSLIFRFVTQGIYFDLGIVVISPHIAALIIQFPITFFTGFWLNRFVTFSQSPLRGRIQLFRYLLSVSGSLLLNYFILKGLVEVAGVYPTMAKVLTEIVVAIYSFCMSKFFTFRGNTGNA